MSEPAVAVLALAVWLGALSGWGVPRWPAAIACVVFLLARRPALLVVAAAGLAAGLSAAAWSGLDVAPGRAAGWATLVGDPEAVPGGVRVELRLDGHHLDGWAHGPAGAALGRRAAGERVEVEGTLRPLGDRSRQFLGPSHIGARIEVEEVGEWRRGSIADQAAGAVRRSLERGARSLDEDDRSLLLGVVLGSDGDRSPVLTERFRGAGLSHLLAVSGESECKPLG